MTTTATAACRPHVDQGNDLWHPPGQESPEQRRQREAHAKQICAACPLQAHCLTAAIDLDSDHGIWGGLTPEERASTVPACADEPGTYKGWNRHRRARQEPCQPCKDAHEKRLAEGRERSRKAGREGGAKAAAQRPKAACGTPSGHSRHTRLRETVCDDCRDARRMYLRALKQQRAS